MPLHTPFHAVRSSSAISNSRTPPAQSVLSVTQLLYPAPAQRRKLKPLRIPPELTYLTRTNLRLSQRHLEVHQFVPMRVVHSGHEEPRPLCGIIKVANIEE